jgi:hypothetical protein
MSQCVGYGVISRVRTREKDAAVRRGVTLRRRRVVVGCCGPEESDFAAEESYGEGDPDAEEGYEEYEEDDPDAEEGYEGVWDEVQEALSAMEHEEFDDTTEADCARSQASRPSSAASSQASVRS